MPTQVVLKEDLCATIKEEASITDGTVVSSVGSTVAISNDDEDELRKLRKINFKRKITGKLSLI